MKEVDMFVNGVNSGVKEINVADELTISVP